VELDQTLVNVSEVAKDVVSSLAAAAAEKHIELKALFPQSRTEIYLDRDKIVQVFTNLIMNAIKFTPDRGRVSVEIIERPEEVECRVSDTGIGIAPENIDKLFAKFQQFNRQNEAGPEGTGLGLAITRGLVQMHKGRIWAESKPGEGSRFIFTLPKKHPSGENQERK
jgi:signal transduction histidine kinase